MDVNVYQHVKRKILDVVITKFSVARHANVNAQKNNQEWDVVRINIGIRNHARVNASLQSLVLTMTTCTSHLTHAIVNVITIMDQLMPSRD